MGFAGASIIDCVFSLFVNTLVETKTAYVMHSSTVGPEATATPATIAGDATRALAWCLRARLTSDNLAIPAF